MKPTVQAPDFYKIGNDYVQAPLSSFYDVDTVWDEKSLCEAAGVDETEWSAYSGVLGTKVGEPKFYQDGIYTKLADKLADGEYSAAPFKNPEGFNKRRVFVDNADANLPEGVVFNTEETNEVQPVVREEQYGKADIIVDGINEEA